MTQQSVAGVSSNVESGIAPILAVTQFFDDIDPEKLGMFSKQVKRLPGWLRTEGRAGRMEFFGWLVLWHVVLKGLSWVGYSLKYEVGFVSHLPVGVQAVMGWGLLVLLLASAWPVMTAGVRRLHDSGASGWWMLIPLLWMIPFVLLLLPATKGPNRFTVQR